MHVPWAFIHWQSEWGSPPDLPLKTSVRVEDRITAFYFLDLRFSIYLSYIYRFALWLCKSVNYIDRKSHLWFWLILKCLSIPAYCGENRPISVDHQHWRSTIQPGHKAYLDCLLIIKRFGRVWKRPSQWEWEKVKDRRNHQLIFHSSTATCG